MREQQIILANIFFEIDRLNLQCTKHKCGLFCGKPDLILFGQTNFLIWWKLACKCVLETFICCVYNLVNCLKAFWCVLSNWAINSPFSEKWPCVHHVRHGHFVQCEIMAWIVVKRENSVLLWYVYFIIIIILLIIIIISVIIIILITIIITKPNARHNSCFPMFWGFFLVFVYVCVCLFAFFTSCTKSMCLSCFSTGLMLACLFHFGHLFLDIQCNLRSAVDLQLHIALKSLSTRLSTVCLYIGMGIARIRAFCIPYVPVI